MSATLNRFAKTRQDHAAETAEDYVEIIYKLGLTAAEKLVRTTDVVKELQVAQPTVTKVLTRMKREGLVHILPRQGIELTPMGENLAKQSLARHELVLQWLRSLGVSEAQSELDAEGIEHHLSEESLHAIKKFLDAR